MTSCIDELVGRTKPKVKAILRTRAHYTIAQIIGQFKTHSWGLLEYFTPCIYHAHATQLQRIDSIQTSFLRNLEITCEEAFIEHNFAPLQLRRDVAILGLLHKCARRETHPSLRKIFYKLPQQPTRTSSRLTPLHKQQLNDVFVSTHSPGLCTDL